MNIYDELTLSLEIGNAAMETPVQVARALRSVADRIEDDALSGVIVDANGNTVGTWKFR